MTTLRMPLAANDFSARDRLVLLTVFEIPLGDKLHFASVEPSTIEAHRKTEGAETTQQEPRALKDDAPRRVVENRQVLDCELTVLGKRGQPVPQGLLLGSVARHMPPECSANMQASTARDA